MKSVVISFSLVMVLALSCSYYEEKNPHLNQVGPAPAGDPSTPIESRKAIDKASFSWIQQNILIPSCIRCHSGAMGVDLSSYDSVMASETIAVGAPRESILFKEIQSGRMPRKAPKLSDEQIQAVSDWIEKGAPREI